MMKPFKHLSFKIVLISVANGFFTRHCENPAQEGSPFIVCMTYAFQTTDKLCFILDLMNGGDLHYHLSQHGTFFENEIRFYACEVILGLDHMHTRGIVYRDLKVRLFRVF